MGLVMVDLMNMNIEGIEFEVMDALLSSREDGCVGAINSVTNHQLCHTPLKVMDALLSSGKHKKIRNLQVQFHVHGARFCKEMCACTRMRFDPNNYSVRACWDA
jgi:hypothetical protein